MNLVLKRSRGSDHEGEPSRRHLCPFHHNKKDVDEQIADCVLSLHKASGRLWFERKVCHGLIGSTKCYPSCSYWISANIVVVHDGGGLLKHLFVCWPPPPPLLFGYLATDWHGCPLSNYHANDYRNGDLDDWVTNCVQLLLRINTGTVSPIHPFSRGYIPFSGAILVIELVSWWTQSVLRKKWFRLNVLDSKTRIPWFANPLG